MIKCIVWDLDDTLWNGILKETKDIIINDNIIEYIKKFDELGIIQSIASKNDYNAAMMKLREFLIDEYFIYPQINYMEKSDSIKKIAERFNISYDSIVFTDDNDFERYSVNSFLPEVLTVEPKNIGEIYNLVYNNKSNKPTNHRELMKIREKRLTASGEFKGSREEFLMTCNMEITIRQANNEDIDRICELSTRANKLNNLTQKADYQYINYIINKNHNTIVYVCQLKDIFGYHGIVGVCFMTCSEAKAIINLFCISCRIEGRGIGVAFIQEAIDKVTYTNENITKIECRYEANKKNISSLMLLKIIGFKAGKSGHEDVKIMELDIPYKKNNIEWVKINERESV